MPPIIQIHNLGKKYSVREVQPYLSLRDIVSQKFKNILARGQERDKEFWALENINLKIEKGERIGIIGRNGAGKSTLLKILSKITPPTTGEIKLRGRVASLLEVGTGFHPELSGRENIFLNGSILGLTKREINQKLEEIIDFSGVEKFIDTPLKHYSSGMQLRLAFSVAAHLEPEILLIDEVLAVGDIEFQKKCIGKMEEISKSSGRTILFVSHNMAAIGSFCVNCLWLEQGQIEGFGTADAVISNYINSYQNKEVSGFKKSAAKEFPVVIDEIILHNNGAATTIFRFDESIDITVKAINNSWKGELKVGIAINDLFGKRIATDTYIVNPSTLEPVFYFKITLPDSFFTPGRYNIDLSVLSTAGNVLDIEKSVVFFEILKEGTAYEYLTYDYGYAVMESHCEILPIK